jgi:hypothetical protein
MRLTVLAICGYPRFLWVVLRRRPVIVANDRESVHKDAAETGKDEALKN